MSQVKTVFIGGARAITHLDQNVQARLQSLIASGCHVVVGDAAGVDKAVQKVLADHKYQSVNVYASNGTVRNNIGDWAVVAIQVSDDVKGFNFYAAKDKAMAKAADIGFMIWNGKSRGTFENIINLASQHKPCLVYHTIKKAFFLIKDVEAAEKLKCESGKSTSSREPAMQISMFHV